MLPAVSKAPSIISHPPIALHSLQKRSSSSSASWKSSNPPAVIPLVPVLPPPVVIAPIDPTGIPATQTVSLLSQPEPTSGNVTAHAVAVATEPCGRIARPITGRGWRDQLQATAAANKAVSFRFIWFYK